MHLLPLGFIAVLDFVHLLAYLHDAAHAFRGRNVKPGWKTYVAWLQLAWSGKTAALQTQLSAAAAKLAKLGSGATERKRTIDETWTYVTNNRERMDYPEYRRLKGSEKFWLTAGAEAMLQLRAAQLSDDDRWSRNWQRRRPHRAAGTHRLAQAA
jgi:hypothetical protein